MAATGGEIFGLFRARRTRESTTDLLVASSESCASPAVFGSFVFGFNSPPASIAEMCNGPGSMFVAIATNGLTVYTSKNGGVSWTPTATNIPASTTVVSITYMSNVNTYVVLTSGFKIYTAAANNLTNWTNVATGTGAGHTAIKATYTNGYCFAVGGTSTASSLLWSSNGNTWTELATTLSTRMISDVVYSTKRSKFLAVGSQSGSNITAKEATNPELLANWTTSTVTGATGNGGALACSDSADVVICGTGTGPTNLARCTGGSGASWTVVTTLTSVVAQWVDLYYTGSVFLASAYDGTYGVSTDNGASWTIKKLPSNYIESFITAGTTTLGIAANGLLYTLTGTDLIPIIPITRSGTLAATETGTDTLAATGTVSDSLVSGTLAVTETGTDTASAAGDVIVSGTASVTETGSDVAAVTGDVFVKGTLIVSETGIDTVTASGKIPVKGTVSSTETGNDTAAITAKLIVKGTASASESGIDTAAITAKLVVKGSAAVTEVGTDTASLSGKIIVKGSVVATETGADLAALSGKITVKGTLNATETGSDTAAITGNLGSITPRTGTIAATESGIGTAAITGKVLVKGSAAASESGSDSAALAGKIITKAQIAAQEVGSDTAALIAKLIVKAQIAVQESGADTAALLGKIKVAGAIAATESGLGTCAITGKVIVRGSLAVTEVGADIANISGIAAIPGGYPSPTQVLAGVVYGPAGQYVGTAKAATGYVFDISTGQIVKVLNANLVMSL